MVQIILTSTVIASFITVVFNWIKLRRDQYSTDVIKERSEWRKSVEKLAEEIVKVDNSRNFLTAVGCLKIHLNPYRRKDYLVIETDKVQKDEYLWKLIYQIEEDKQLETNFPLYQKQIIEMIGILLKENWEKSKNEAIGDITSLMVVIIWFICCGLFLSSLVQNEILHVVSIQGITVSFMTLGLAIAIVRFNSIVSLTEVLNSWKIYFTWIGVLGITTFCILFLKCYFTSVAILYKIILLFPILIAAMGLIINICKEKEEKKKHCETIKITCHSGTEGDKMCEINSDLMKKVIELDCSQKAFQDLMNIFSTYISSNEDYLYSKGYLIDAFKQFEKATKQYKEKYNLLRSLDIKNLTKHCQEDWTVIFDNHFVISSQQPEVIISFNDFLESDKKTKWLHYESLIKNKFKFYDIKSEVEVILIKGAKIDFYLLQIDKIKYIVGDFFGGPNA